MKDGMHCYFGTARVIVETAQAVLLRLVFGSMSPQDLISSV